MNNDFAPDVLDTQKVWNPIEEMCRQQEQALRDLELAASVRDYEAMKKAFDLIVEMEQRSPQLYAQARKYALSKYPLVKVQ